MTSVKETPVLIIGGGPVGLCLALDLAKRGIRSTLVETEAGTALELLAKAGTINERTMEYCRWLGIADAIANIGFPDDYPRDTIYCTGLNGFELGRDKMPSTRDRSPPPETPEMLRKAPQHLFDPLVARAVVAAGMTDILYSTDMVSFEQDETGVTAQCVTGPDRAPLTIRAQYLVGCDGAGSKVRRALDIAFDGIQLDYSVSAMIAVERLEDYHPFGKAERFMFVGPEGTWCNLTAVDGQTLWRLTMVGSEDKLDPKVLDLGPVIRRAFGRDDIPYEIKRVVPWRRSQFAAASYGKGRVFIGGDACHTTSPTGGHGLNTGIGDSMDLGWMLQALVNGWGGPGLLQAYTAERRPVADRNTGSSTQNYKAWVQKSGRELLLDDTPEGEAQRRAVGAEMSEALRQEWYSLGIGMGYRYDKSPIVVPDGTPPTADDPTIYIPTARPGHRAPHAWLADGRSTIDLFGDSFVLLRFGTSAPDAAPLVAAAKAVGMPLSVEQIDEPAIAALYAAPLVLVRPDGMVAWRGVALPADASGLVDTVRGAATTA